MPVLASCPPPVELEQFLLGRLDDEDSEAVEDHVGWCAPCQEQIATLAAEDELVRAMRANRSPEDAAADLVNLLVPHFKRIASDPRRTADSPGDPAEARSTTGPDRTTSFLIRCAAADAPTLGPATTATGHAAKPQAAAPHENQQFLGPYEIRGVLGFGGMGTVFKGYDPRLRRSVAIKVLQSKLLDMPDMAEQMVREAQAAAAVEHDNIVPIHSVETHGDVPCIVMPLLRGETLYDRLDKSNGPLPLKEMVRIAREATAGLAAAHAHGLIHCDIKPANLWLESPQGRVKILDFGLAIHRGSDEGGSGAISGTPGYLAPEQARGLSLDQRTDLFSLGCVLYRMATGHSPYTGEPHLCALWTVLSEPPTPALKLNPVLPAVLSDLIGRMLAQEPNERPAAAAEVLKILEDVEHRWAEHARRAARRRWIAAMFGVAALSSGVGYFAWMQQRADPVEVTFLGDGPPLAAVLRHEGQEQSLTLGPRQMLALAPGDYFVRPSTAHAGRTLVPDRFAVLEGKPQTVQIAYVGEVARHATHTQAVTAVAVAPDSSPPLVLSVGLDRTLVAWESSEAAPARFVDLPHSARCVAISPNGKLLATAGGNKQPPIELAINLWDTQRLVAHGQPLEGHTRIVTALAWSPDGSQLASAGADGVFLWNWKTGESLPLEQGEPQAILALAYSADGRRLLTGSDDGAVTTWNVGTRTLLEKRAAGESAIRAVAFLPEGLAAAGDDARVRIWKESDPDPRELKGHTGPVLALAASSDGGQILSGDAEGAIRIWSVASGQTTHILHGHTRGVQAVAFGGARQAVSGGADGSVRLWQLPFPDGLD